MKKISRKVARYLFLWLPNGYITREEFLQQVDPNYIYMKEKGLKEFIRRGYVEKRKKDFIVYKNESYKKDRIVSLDIYVLTPEGVLCLIDNFSGEYPWLCNVKCLGEKTFFSNNSKFKIDDIEHNSIKLYLELCSVEEYLSDKFLFLLKGSTSDNPFRALIENAQREWVKRFLPKHKIDFYMNYNGPFYQFCQDMGWAYEFFCKHLDYIKPNMTEVPTQIAGVYISKRDGRNILGEDIDKAAGNLNNAGVLFYNSMPYVIFHYWNKAPYIAKQHTEKIVQFIEGLATKNNFKIPNNPYRKYSAFVFSKNIIVLKHLIEKHYVTNQSARFSESYFKGVIHLYLTPKTAEHFPVFYTILNTPERMDALCDKLILERGYSMIPGFQDKRIVIDRTTNEEILMGFEMDARIIYFKYEEYQNYDMEQIIKKVEGWDTVGGTPMEKRDAIWIKLFKGRKVDKDTYSKRIYNKPYELLTPYYKKCRILCFDYQKTFYESLFSDWIRNGSVVVEIIAEGFLIK